MARRPEPWYWARRNVWMVTINGVRHNLGLHPDAASKPAKSTKTGRWNAPQLILDAFHNIMVRPVVQRVGTAALVATPPDDQDSLGIEYVNHVFQRFLDWAKENNAHRTWQRYFDFLDSFDKRFFALTMEEMSKSHVTLWLKENKQWNSTTKRNAMTAIMRAFNWSCDNIDLPKNPIRGMEKPEAKKRIVVVSTDQFAEVLEHTKGPFRDLLIFCFDCGCRPEEVKKLEARHLQMEKQRAVLASAESKKGIQRAIYFATPRSLKIIKRLAKENPTGPLFLNRSGNPWTAGAVKCQFDRLEKKIGRRLTHYAMRHSFITRKLIAGVDSHVVAALSGHKNTAMIDATYSHIAEDHAFMLKEARRS